MRIAGRRPISGVFLDVCAAWSSIGHAGGRDAEEGSRTPADTEGSLRFTRPHASLHKISVERVDELRNAGL
jgi:hypothetical protein